MHERNRDVLFILTIMNWTGQGIRTVKDSPGRIEEGIKSFETAGGKIRSVYTVMGEYDLVAVVEAPSDEVAMTFLLSLGSQGNVRTTTLKAFPLEQFRELVGRLP